MFNDMNNSFDEFFWEQELKKEDAKMHFFMSEIPSVIDLPNEYELLLNKVQKKIEFSTSFSVFQADDDFFDDFTESEIFAMPEEWKNSKWYVIYSEFERLLENWRLFYIESDCGIEGIGILCVYAKLISLTVNLINFADDGQVELEKAVSKRIIRHVNTILNILENKKILEFTQTEYHIQKLLEIRTMVVNVRFSLE